ncbi:restriction endonuclease subunit S [Escherichia coli]|uniref:restriction endonuclease subunit S n=1 Tax=Escherichia coli TaxID=562 RepID=UPI000BE8EC93|nr:restriction endonuclease subunit S [Escherichia coli]EFC5425776.1 restriction endonuclease subunit S [Escherichia coli]MCJ1097917.1 restriction endonuclease subunit S [Escherichia coli]MCJ1201853.1 restriction endonuclease subunit S [Escherichia coli]MCW9759224.1 restriction endonuclease subunit S [Escherichia coli]HBE6722185.1 restriction endonuclease subunit S [Escherichia coli]
MIRGGDLSFGEVISPSVFAPLSYKDGKGTAQTGDVLILIKGACIDGPEGVARVKQVNHGHLFNGSCFRLAFTNRDIDGPFFIAYSQSKFFLKQKKRQVANTGISYNDEESIHGFLIPELEIDVKKYIGDKVRQAERLRAWAKRLERSLDAFIEHFQPEKKEYKKLFSRVPNNLLTNMLTATTYRERYISNQKNLKAISRIQPISYYLSSITNGYDERNEIDNGLPYVKVANVRAGYIDLKNTPRVRLSALTDASAKQKPEKGDLLLTRKGSFGIAAVVMESASFLCSSEVFSCKPSKPEFMPILSWFLNSEAGNMQFWQFSTGTTMPGINQENLQNILIPDFSTCDIEQFNSIHKNRYEAKKNAELLTDTAKTLVEALIEGQLTEQQLIQAQQALEDGDNSLDQAILSKLSAEGYAIEGATPLFSDVDELYSLLEEAAQAEAEE